MASDPPLERLHGEKYISLGTYRKRGDEVRTTVWFVELGGALVVRTHQDSWKARRMRAQGKASVAASTFSGKPSGERVQMRARPARHEEAETADALFGKKYTLQKWGTDLASRFSGKRYVFFILEPYEDVNALQTNLP